MRNRLRLPSPTALVAWLALFIAVGGGSAFAVSQINGNAIQDRSIPASKHKRNSIGGAEVREGSLGPVRIARRANRVGNLTPEQTLQRCPLGTYINVGACIERGWRPAERWSAARLTCDLAAMRLPDTQELTAVIARPDVTLAPEGELTSDTGDPLPDGTIQARVVLADDKAGLTPDTAAGARPFRCATDPRDHRVLDPPR